MKLAYDLKYHRMLSELYELISKLALTCIRRSIPLVIENPYGAQHYLTTHWSVKPKVIDADRRDRGDYFRKPTQYFFIGCEPCQNFVFEALDYVETRNIENMKNGEKDRQTLRSEIHPQYANRFIKEFILDEEIWR